MCSRDPPTLHPALTKANGKTLSPRPVNHGEARIDTGNSLPNPGGRLKFFKDGKFILELSHRRDGDRTTWFPVPKKTFWPPASTTPNRQESSTALSGKNPFHFHFCFSNSLRSTNFPICVVSFFFCFNFGSFGWQLVDTIEPMAERSLLETSESSTLHIHGIQSLLSSRSSQPPVRSSATGSTQASTSLGSHDLSTRLSRIDDELSRERVFVKGSQVEQRGWVW